MLVCFLLYITLLTSIVASAQVGQPSIMTNLRQNWVLMATKDPAFCYAVLSQYSKQYSSSHKDAGITDPLPHISNVIEMVNARLGDPDLETSDGTIGAVASMVNYEVSNPYHAPV
jgi:hypothetical protein